MQFQVCLYGALLLTTRLSSIAYGKFFRNARNLFQRVSLEQDKGLMVKEGGWVDSQYIRRHHIFDKLHWLLHRNEQGMELYCHLDQESWVETMIL
jgi:hypothetical protein